MKSKTLIAAGAGYMCVSGIALANQTVAYSYDALGRLIQSQVQSGTGSGTTQVFQYVCRG